MAELYFILYFYSVIKYITLIMFYHAFYTVAVFNVFVFILVCSYLFIHFNSRCCFFYYPVTLFIDFCNYIAYCYFM